MKEQERKNIRASTAAKIENEIDRLTYTNPKNDFEHVWNCAIDKAADCCSGYSD